jgi:hypothetical protein
MSTIKQQVVDLIQKLPDSVTLDQVMAELYFKMQVGEGLKQLDEGKGIAHEQVEQRLSPTSRGSKI